MARITRVEQALPAIRKKKKVAAYARVSRETERLAHSLSAQVSYYSSLIQKNPEWEYAGVYADEGITGTSTDKRSEFLRLIDDYAAGKIDIILVKSISRFGRNTVDVLKTTRYLKELGVEVRFEEQNINSLSGDGELMLTILASFAEEESKNMSANIKWAKRKNFEQGKMTNAAAPYGYAYDPETYSLVIVPGEAEIVRRIFRYYLEDDYSVYKIAKILNEEGIPSPRNTAWAQANLRRMIQNPVYVGNLLLGKFYSDGPLTQKHKKNHGERPMYYAEGTHEGIIDMETFNRVQEKFKFNTENGCYRGGTQNCFSGSIICGCCRKPFGRSITKFKGGIKEPAWNCKQRTGDRHKCAVVAVKEEELKSICAAVLGLPEFSEESYSELVDHIEVTPDDDLRFFLSDGTVRTHHYPRRRKLRSPRRSADG